MNDSGRPRRPHLDREEPQRGFGTFFGAAEPRPRAEPNPAEDDVARGVGMGYRLIEEYLKRGQQVAEAMWNSQPPLSSMGVPGFGVPPERVLEYGAQVVNLWFQMASKAWSAPPQEHSDPGGFDFVAPGEPAAAPSTAPARPGPLAPLVSLDLASAFPLEVTVELRSESARKELLPHLLRTADGEAPGLKPAVAWIGEGHVRVSLEVPPSQPPGTYVGVVVDAATNLPLGTITAVIRSR
jgi:hypothetical protein